MAIACGAEAATTSLSITPTPTALRVSWPSNSAIWQLTSTTDLSFPVWQTLFDVPSFSNNTFFVNLPRTNATAFFRLKQSGDTCALHATPSLITSGHSSLLSWCAVAGTAYRLTPGPGSVSGGSFTVSPTVTTVYTLTASNAFGIITNSAAIVVGPCGYGSISNMVGKMLMDYAIKKAAGTLAIKLNHAADLTFHLTRSGGSDTAPLFTGTLDATRPGLIDREEDSTSGELDVTEYFGTGTIVTENSAVTLEIDCTSGTYTLSVISSIAGEVTFTTPNIKTTNPDTFGYGQLVVINHPLPTDSAMLTFSGPIVARSPTWSGGGDYFEVGNGIDDDLYFNGLADDSDSGTAQIEWNITPGP